MQKAWKYLPLVLIGLGALGKYVMKRRMEQELVTITLDIDV